jgi:hypothetical protein
VGTAEPSGPTNHAPGWTPEARALMERDPALGLPTPRYDGRSLANVMPSVLRATGTSLGPGPPIAPPLTDDLDPLRARRPESTVVILLVDGLGWLPYSAWSAARASRGRTPWGRARPITTVFPSTTVAALTSLASGTPAGRHGVLASLLYLPKIDTLVDVLRMSPAASRGREELVQSSWSPSDVSFGPTLFGRGLVGAAATRHGFQGTGFNRLLYEGAEFLGYSTASDLVHLLSEALGRPSPPPVVCAYWDELDTVQHLRGPGGSLFDFEADRLEHLLAHLARQVDGTRRRQVTVLVTADHGQVALDPASRLRVDLVPEIAREMSRPLAGEGRAGFLAALPGRQEALREALVQHLPPGHRILAVPDAVTGGLFGPPPHHPELVERLGDWVVLMPTPTALLGATLRPGSRSPEFRGGHGGLTADELLVPLVAGSLAEFAES